MEKRDNIEIVVKKQHGIMPVIISVIVLLLLIWLL
jgi:hypothetical protein